jgi:phenylacetate-coenzyme A ligase PaaK-like adenylate-forming protein
MMLQCNDYKETFEGFVMKVGLKEKMLLYWGDTKSIAKTMMLKRELLKNQRMNPEELARIKEHKLRKMLRHAVGNSEFYRDYYKGIDIDTCRLNDLPTITKRQMMDNYDLLVTDKRLNRRDLAEYLADPENARLFYKNEFIILNSSGTTGEKAIMGYHAEEFRYVFAAGMARGDKGASNLGSILKILVSEPIRLANIMLINSHSASFICTFRLCPAEEYPLMKNKFISVFTPIDELVKILNDFQPHILQAYSTVFNYLAYEQLEGRLRLKFDDPRCSLVSLSEPLEEKTRDLVKQAFGINIINTYGACESIIIARECQAHTGLHINSDLIYYEPVDENYNPVEPGHQSNKVLVTNLYTFAQPMIRYEINDRVTLETDSCTCGSRLPMIRQIEGRTEEILYISKPSGGFEAVHPYLFLSPVLNTQGIKEFQVEQIERDKIIFRVVPDRDGPKTPQELVDIMERSMEREGFAGRLTFVGEIVDMIPRDKVSGKVVQVKSRLGKP